MPEAGKPKKPYATAKPGRKPSPEKRAAIVDAARRLIARHGADSATTREIAALADTTERTLFKHFGSKDALIQEVIEQVSLSFMRDTAFRRVADSKPFSAAEFAAWHRDFLLERITAAEASRESYKILFGELLRDNAFRKRYGAKWMEQVFVPLSAHLHKMQRSGEIGKTQSPRALAGAFFSLNLGYLVSRYALAPEAGWNGKIDAATIASLFMAACGTKLQN